MLNFKETFHKDKKYEGVVEIYLPACLNPGPGLGHSLLSMNSVIAACYYNDQYPWLNHHEWGYGRWTDFFEPFWDEEAQQSILSQQLPGRRINVWSPHDRFYGMDYLLYGSTQDIYKDFYKDVYQPKSQFTAIVDFLKDIDCAIHVRKGDHHLQHSLEFHLRKSKDILARINPKNLFVMTDQRDVVDGFQQTFPAIEVISLCPTHYDGHTVHTRNVDGMARLIKDVEIAKHAKYFIGSAFSQASLIVDVVRDGQNVFYV